MAELLVLHKNITISSSENHILNVDFFMTRSYMHYTVAWNSLPDYLLDPTCSVDSFLRDLKTLLFSFY